MPAYPLAYTGKQILTNLAWALAPNLVIKAKQKREPKAYLTDPKAHGDYCEEVLGEYIEQLQVASATDFFPGKKVMEIGPGNSLYVGLRVLAYGAEQYVAVDRFYWAMDRDFRSQVVAELRQRLDETQWRRIADLADVYVNNPRQLEQPGRLLLMLKPFEDIQSSGGQYDLIWSRAVLEHVQDLQVTFKHIGALLKPGGLTVHKADLTDHNMSGKDHPLGFLQYPPTIWRLMGSHRDLPNRCRRPDYRKAIEQAGLELVAMNPTRTITLEQVQAIQPELIAPYRDYQSEELRHLGLFITCRKS